MTYQIRQQGKTVGIRLIVAEGRLYYPMTAKEAQAMASYLITAAYDADKYVEPKEPSKADRLIEIEKKIALLRKEQADLLGHPPPVVEAKDAEAVRFDVYGQPTHLDAVGATGPVGKFSQPMVPRYQDGFTSFEK